MPIREEDIKKLDALSNEHHRSRILLEVLAVAAEVLGEAQGEMQPAHWAKRQALAVRICRPGGSFESIAVALFWLVVASGGKTNERRLGESILAVWDDAAGVTGPDRVAAA